eukprot:m.34767 g.34767  ORF g.34767 m.34767 type:complete len:157 (+) comp32012_c0_seq1:366-836(+)
MADPKWQRHLNPVMSRAVPLTSNLLGGKLLDKLLEAECLTSHQYDEIVRLKDKDGPDDVSRKLLMMLRRKPSPSFDTFCKVLRDPEVEEGMNLYKCLMGISPAEPAPASSQELDWSAAVLSTKPMFHVVGGGSVFLSTMKALDFQRKFFILFVNQP